MKRFLIATLFAILCVSCAPEYVVVEVSGAKNNFCIPAEYVIGDIPWIPRNEQYSSDGVAFRGCWSPEKNVSISSECKLPIDILSVVVSSKSEIGTSKWENMHNGSIFRRAVNHEKTSFEIFQDGGIILVSNEELFLGMEHIWLKTSPYSPDSDYLQNGDSLLASCNEEDIVVPKNGTRTMISCKRRFNGMDYTLDYTFESDTRIPDNTKFLDDSIIEQLGKWSCDG